MGSFEEQLFTDNDQISGVCDPASPSHSDVENLGIVKSGLTEERLVAPIRNHGFRSSYSHFGGGDDTAGTFERRA